MILCTNGKRVVYGYHDSYWYDYASTVDHIGNGITHVFKVPTKDVPLDYMGTQPDVRSDEHKDPMSHSEAESLAIEIIYPEP